MEIFEKVLTVIPKSFFLSDHSDKMNYYAIKNDGRDILIKVDGKVWAYRDGTNNIAYSIFPIPKDIDESKIDSRHPLIKVKSNPIKKIKRPKIEIDHDYYKKVQNIEIIVDEDGRQTDKAKIFPELGKVILNKDFFKGLPHLWQVYVLYHEVAHLWMVDETKNDIWASYLYVKSGFPPSQAIMCLKYTISNSNEEKDSRGSNASSFIRNNIELSKRELQW